nr:MULTISPECIES: hypothetical protein [Myxococcaceae]
MVGAVAAAVLVGAAWGCGDDGVDQTPTPIQPQPGFDAGVDAGTDAGVDAGIDAGTDAGTDGGTDAGTDGGTDAGTDGGTGGGTDAGTDGGFATGVGDPSLWPTEAQVNYTQKFGLGTVRDVGIDEGYNIWLLNGGSVGVLRPGDTRPNWVSGLGQAGRGFSSTVICGGAPGRAYVGYAASYNDIPGGQFIYSPDGCDFEGGYTNCDPSRYSAERFQEYQQGDLDIVRMGTDNAPKLEEHIWRNVTNNPFKQATGLRNTNDHHFDEDRSVYSCVRAMRGPAKGDVFIGTNHGYTRISGLVYNSHRHPIWYTADKSQRAGYAYGIGIAQDGDVLMATDWSVGTVSPIGDLKTWDREADATLNPEKIKNRQVLELNSQEDFDFWRGFEQTKDGRYYLGSKDYGLWRLKDASDGARLADAHGERIPGAPSNIQSLAATDDGSLFIGAGDGLYRMDANKQITRVSGLGGDIKRLVYDPTVTPSMLLVLSGGTLYVLRGY